MSEEGCDARRPHLPNDEATNQRVREAHREYVRKKSLRMASNGLKWSRQLEKEVRDEVFSPLLACSRQGGLGCDMDALRRRLRRLYEEGVIREEELSESDFIMRARRRRAGQACAADEEGVILASTEGPPLLVKILGQVSDTTMDEAEKSLILRAIDTTLSDEGALARGGHYYLIECIRQHHLEADVLQNTVAFAFYNALAVIKTGHVLIKR